MSIRIYALAKQLKVESKALVDVCKKLGLEGKGSALASLSEEEAEQIKVHFQADAKSKVGSSPDDEVPLQRPVTTLPTGKIPVLKPTHPSGKSRKSKTETSAAPESEYASFPAASEESHDQDEEKSVSRELKRSVSRSKSVAAPPDFPGEPSFHDPTVASIQSEKTEKDEGRIAPRTDVSSTVREDVRDSGERKGEAESKGQSGEQLSEAKKTPVKRSPLSKAVGEIRSGMSPPPTKSSSPVAPVSQSVESPTRPEMVRGPVRSIDSKVPSLDSKRKKAGDLSSSRDGKDVGGGAVKSGESFAKTASPKPSAPTVRLAPLPKPASKPTKSASEPAPQKPDMKLPKEAIRAAQMGASRPLTEHIRKHEEKRLQAASGKKDAKVVKKKARPLDPFTPATVEEDPGKKKGTKRVRGRDGKMIDVVEDPRAVKRKGKSGGESRRFREDGDDETAYIPKQLRRQRRGHQNVSTAAPRKNDIVVQLPCTVKQYAELTGLSVSVVIRKLMEFGTPMVVNSLLDKEAAELLAAEFGLKVEVRDEVTLEDRLVTSLFETPDLPESLRPRPPIVTFLGHVDHGKTSLLDRILNLNVVSGEKGGITQHIRAYRVPTKFGDVTFVDTPGHEAFTEMRARGANSTDIVVLVVAADDGVMPQTEEAISHAKAAGVPIVVALNKMDLHGANPDKAIQGLAANELIPSEWGGDVEVVRCSALSGMGIDELMQTLLTVAELHELKANPDRPAIGVALEAELQAGQGVVCKALVRNGTLRTGDVVLCGSAYGRVKAMYDTLDARKSVEEATPGTPVQLVGLDIAPTAGSKFCVLQDISEARQIAEKRAEDLRKQDLADIRSHVTLENLFQRMNQGSEPQTLNIIIRADVRGSIEAIRKELGKLDHPEVKLKILQASVGGVTEADVQLADASDAIIVGFNVVPDENARSLADKKKVQVRRYDIIYNLSNDIKAALEGMLKPLEQVRELGRALVQRVFAISRLGSIAGCRVLSGHVERDSKMRIIRESRIIGEYFIDSLKREKDDAKDVREGYECGIKLRGFNDLKEGDILEAYKIEEVARTF